MGAEWAEAFATSVFVICLAAVAIVWIRRP
jgi:hypothetical protein